MTREEAIEQIKWYFEEDDGISAEDITKEAVYMAIEALKVESSAEGRYEKAIKTLQEMPKYINSNIIGKKLEVFNHTKEE